jgi:hypothetical protein
MKTCDQLQTMAVAYAEICRGEDPWIALGNFMNDWFDYAKDRREQLVTEPLSIPEPLTLDLHRWAAFCAASVEWLCQRYTVACPPWVHDPIYTLSTPWFYPLVLSHSQFYLSKSTGSVQAAALCWLQGGGEGLRMKGGVNHGCQVALSHFS